MASKSYYATDDKSAIVVIGYNGSNQWVYPLTPGDPASISDHIDPALKAAAQNPLPKADYDAYVAALPKPEPRTRTPEQKLKDAGLSVDELKHLLGLA